MYPTHFIFDTKRHFRENAGQPKQPVSVSPGSEKPTEDLTRLEHRVANRNNSFDLIRHLAALAVLISHHYALSGLEEPGLQGLGSLGSMAVLAFFSISGFLIAQSFINSSSFYTYMKKRAARIFPALIVCAFVMVFFVASLLKPQGLEYALSAEALADFLKISTFGRAEIEGVTDTFLFKESLNGSLWTLKIEFAFYVLLAALLTVLRGALLPLGMILAFCATAWIASHSAHPLASKLAIYSSVGIAFFVGAALHFYRDAFAGKSAKIATAMVSFGLILATFNTSFSVIFADIGFSLLVLSIGTLCSDPLIKSRFDISYGMYLYAFPVQQILINTTSLSFYPSMLASIVLTIVLATLSWLMIEKPALKLAHKRNQAKVATATQV